MGKFLAALIVVCALGAGIGIYYMQEYAYYEPVAPVGDDVTLVTPEGEAEAIPVEGFEAIDAYSSPIRYRACFRTPLSLEEARRLIVQFVTHYNEVRLHSAIDYITPKDKLQGRADQILQDRDRKLQQAREGRQRKRQLQHAAQAMAGTDPK